MNYLISFPRSGNTFLRYCLEVISQQPTLPQDYESDSCIYKYPGANINITNYTPLLKKVHFSYLINDTPDKIILLIRNYKDTFVSHGCRSIQCCGENYKENVLSISYNHYIVDLMNNLKYYDEYDGEKIIIYYDDLIKHTRNELLKILNHLEVKTDVDGFFNIFKYHVNKAKELYKGGTIIKGNFVESDFDILTQKLYNFDKQIYNKYLKTYKDMIYAT